MSQSNRLCVTFEMDYDPIGLANHYQHQQKLKFASLNENVNRASIRRHSSDLKNSPKINPICNISRANSDLLLHSISKRNEKINTENFFETKRINNTLKRLASYINVRPRYKYKEHDYKIAKMLNIRLEKCRVCSETIYFNCLECLQCKLTGHKKCLQRIYVKCPNKLMPPRLKVFGLEISNENQISEVLSCCIMEIEKRPIHQLKGIYKQDGTASIIENLCLSFEFGSHLIDLCQISPHNLAGVVKQYLAQISTPIFSPSLQNELITIGREWPVRKVPYTQTGITILIFELRRLIGCLTTTNRNNLAYLFYHFKRIVDRENITEMSANALGVVFAPIIFQKESHENVEAITGLARIDSEINSSGENDINRIILEDNDQNNLIQSKNDSSDTKIETNFVANGEDHRADCSPGIIDDVVRRKFFNPNPLQTFSMQTVNNQFIENFHHHHHCSNHQSYNVFKNSKIKHSSTTNNNNNRGVKILLDVTVKIRIIELMIIYVNDLFSDWI